MNGANLDPDDLWSRYLAGEALSDDEDGWLAAAVQADPALLDELVDDDRVNGLLATFGRTAVEAKPFDVRVIERLALERDSARFASKVDARLRAVRLHKDRGMPTRRWWVSAVALGLATATVALVLFRRPTREISDGIEDAVATEVRGDVRVARAGAVGTALVPGQVLRPGERIETAADGRVTWRYLGASRVTLSGASVGWVEASVGKHHAIRIESGHVDAELAPQPAGRTISFETPHARATVVGTRLGLWVNNIETRLEVFQGRVLFENLWDDSIGHVHAGGSKVARAVPRALSVDEPGRASPVASGTTPTPESSDIPLLAFDFENGTTPGGFTTGQVVACPPGGPSGLCILGGLFPPSPMDNVVRTEAQEPDGELFRYTDHLVLSFDYWLGPGKNRLSVQVWNRDKNQNYGMTFFDPVCGGWAHAVVRLRDGRGYRDARQVVADGDRITKLSIVGSRLVGEALYIDNLKLDVVSPAALPSASTVRPPQDPLK